MKNIFPGKHVLCLLPWKCRILVKQVYHFSMMKPVITVRQKQAVDFSFIFHFSLKSRVYWCILVNTKNFIMPKPTIKRS